MDTELARRQRVYAADLLKAPQLAEVLPLFKLTHTARAHRCADCERQIPAGELHFISGGLRVCQQYANKDSRAPRISLRLVTLDGKLVP
jgi:hypothetical protein